MILLVVYIRPVSLKVEEEEVSKKQIIFRI